MNVAVSVGVGLLLLFVEYFVIQRLMNRHETPSRIAQAVIGDGNTVEQTVTVDARRDFVLTKVTNIHNHPPKKGEPAESDSDGTEWLWFLGGFVAICALALGLSLYGEIARAIMAGVALGLLLLAGALLLRGHGTAVPIMRWVTACASVAVALGVGTFWLLSREFDGVSLSDIKADLAGRPASEWLGAMIEVGGFSAVGAFALQALGALLLVFAAAMLVIRVTGVFAAVGALQAPGQVGKLQAWLVGHLYDDSFFFVVWAIAFSIVGAALSGGWLSEAWLDLPTLGAGVPAP